MEVDVVPDISEVTWLSADLVSDARLVLADLDGCLISEGRPFPDACGFVEACGDRLWIISNNSSHTAEALSAELSAIGLNVTADRILLAGEQTLRHLQGALPGRRVALYASDCLKAQARAIGLLAEDQQPDIVMLCRDPKFAIPQIADVTAHCLRGAKLWVSNTDTSHPGQRGTPVPETGALLAALDAVMGEVAFDCIGKPHTHMAHTVLCLTGTAPQDAVFVGDNTDTDGAIARAMGMRFVHVVREGAT